MRILMGPTSLLCAVLVIACSSAPTGLDDIVLGSVAGDIVGQVDQSGRGLIQEGERAGSALLTTAGNELEVASKNVLLLLGDQVDATVRDLSEENRKLIAGLLALDKRAAKLSRGAFELEDALALDVRDLVQSTLLGQDVDFLVQRVDGLTQLENPAGGSYRLSVTGLGFGFDSEVRKGRIETIVLDGQEIDFDARRKDGHRTELRVVDLETFSYWAAVSERRVVGRETKQLERTLEHGEFLVFELPKEADFWTVKGKTSTLQPISAVSSSDRGDLLRKESIEEAKDLKRVTYYVMQPGEEA